MPKVAKDPIPESKTAPVVSSDREITTQWEYTDLDVVKVARQQLDSLRRAGLTYLPKGTGNYDFDFEAPTQKGSAPQTTAPEPNRQEAAKLSVGESKPEFDLKTDSPRPDAAIPETQATETAAASAPSPAKEDAAARSRTAAKSSSTPSRQVDSAPYGPSLGLAQRESALQVLQNEVAGCIQCKELVESRTQTVFGVGNPGARLVFLGEGPGANEDRLGEPFVGDAGQLLDKIMGACKLTRSDVYILNTVKCRPPANRNPSQDELANCWGYAQRQLEILQPEFICCLGSVAARTLLKTTESIGRLRRQFHSYRGSQVLVTYHPAYLLRTPSAKKHVWEDMKLLMKEMGVDLSN